MTESNAVIEYERTFLARIMPPEIHDALPERLVDVYIPDDPAVEHPRLRLRKRGDTYEITKKLELSEHDSSVQREQTIPLTRDEFEALANAHHRLIEKDRYAVALEGWAAEVDVFSGQLEGLVLIDFEFDGEDAKNSFVPPACCLAEVTQDIAIAGGMLAGKSYKDIEPALRPYGYQALSL